MGLYFDFDEVVAENKRAIWRIFFAVEEHDPQGVAIAAKIHRIAWHEYLEDGFSVDEVASMAADGAVDAADAAPVDPWRVAELDVHARMEGRNVLSTSLPDGFLSTWGWGTARDEGYTPDEAVSMVWDGLEVPR